MRLHYLANVRLPSQKAHTYQIMHTCDAFAQAGAQVTLLHANRRNTPRLERVEDVWVHYGLPRRFDIERIPCIDLYTLTIGLKGLTRRLVERLVSGLQLVSYTLALVGRVRPAQADLFYSRDSVPLVALALLRPRLRGHIYFEAHEFPVTRVGRWIRGWLARHAARLAVVNQHLADLYVEQLNVPLDRVVVARNGVSLERFSDLGSRAECRAELGLPPDAFVVGYVGQLHLMGMSKGVDTLASAVAYLASEGEVRLCVLGGPDEMVASIRRHAAAEGLPDEAFVTPGQVSADRVPLWLRAFDVCSLPSPMTGYLAYYTSPLKLFEYMASGTPIVASDLPAVREIVADGESALLVSPGDAAALASALRHLRDDPALGERLAGRARQDVSRHTWLAKAELLLSVAQGR